MSVSKGFSTTIGVLIALIMFPVLCTGLWFFVCAGLLAVAPKEDPALKNLPVGQQQEAEQWNERVDAERKKAAAEQRREVNAEVRAQRQRLENEPVADLDDGPAEAPTAHVPDLDGPEAIVEKDGGKRRELNQRAAEAKEGAAKKSDEEKAAALLKAAELLLPENKAAGQRRLKELIEKYPDTDAAAKAKKLVK